MSHQDGHITAPVNTDDVSSVLGENSHDVGTLCLSGSIVKWNKSKPYRGTSPTVYDRTTHNSANQTGMYLGSRGQATGYPVYWGLKYPMNTAQQNNSGLASSRLLELCYDVAMRSGGKHPNYEYVPPVAGTDFFRLEDFIDYYHHVGAFIDAGVVGVAKQSNNAAKIKVNRFANPYIRAYAKIPNTATGFLFSDLIPNASEYYLVAEFYKESDWKSNSTSVPFYTATSQANLGTTSSVIVLDVLLSDIKSKGGFTENAYNFYVCVGFNRKNGASFYGSSAFVAPWSAAGTECATFVQVMSGAPYLLTISEYATILNLPTYTAFATSPQVKITTADLYFKGTMKNNDTANAMILNNPTNATSLKFAAQAVGSYSESVSGHPISDNPNRMDDNNGYVVPLDVGENPYASDSNVSITIPAGGTKTLHFKSTYKYEGGQRKLMPYGHTTQINFFVSNDNGETWEIVGTKYCNFLRT